MGLRVNNHVVEDGIAWNQKYEVADATSALMDVLLLSGKTDRLIAWYDSATAFSSTAKVACINFPKGAVVYDIQAKITWIKLAAAGTDTWGYSAANT